MIYSEHYDSCSRRIKLYNRQILALEKTFSGHKRARFLMFLPWGVPTWWDSILSNHTLSFLKLPVKYFVTERRNANNTKDIRTIKGGKITVKENQGFVFIILFCFVFCCGGLGGVFFILLLEKCIKSFFYIMGIK